MLNEWCALHPGHVMKFTDVDPSAHAHDHQALLELAAAGDDAAADHPLYKTRLCTNFTHDGRCERGGSCTFAHGAHELRQVPADLPEPRYMFALSLSCPSDVEPSLEFCNLDTHAYKHEAKTELAAQAIRSLGLKVAGGRLVDDDGWQTVSSAVARPAASAVVSAAASAAASAAELPPILPWRKKQLIDVMTTISGSPEARKAAENSYDHWLCYVGGRFGSEKPNLAKVLRQHYGTFSKFVIKHQGQVHPPKSAIQLAMAAAPEASASSGQGSQERVDYILDFLTSNEQYNKQRPVHEILSLEPQPREIVLQIVRAAGGEGIDLPLLRARLETGLRLSKTIKTFKLGQYVRLYESHFRVERIDLGGDRHVDHVQLHDAGDEAGTEAAALPSWTAALLESSGDNELDGFRERLRLDGCDDSVLRLMRPADLVESFGLPLHVAQQLLAEVGAPEADPPAPELPDDETSAAVADLERQLLLRGGGRGGRGGRGSGTSSDLLNELQRLRASEATLQEHVGDLMQRCSDLQLRLDVLEEGRVCTICFERKRDTLVLPCMHAHFCGQCVPRGTSSCPTCRGFIAGILELRLDMMD